MTHIQIDPTTQLAVKCTLTPILYIIAGIRWWTLRRFYIPWKTSRGLVGVRVYMAVGLCTAYAIGTSWLYMHNRGGFTLSEVVNLEVSNMMVASPTIQERAHDYHRITVAENLAYVNILWLLKVGFTRMYLANWHELNPKLWRRRFLTFTMLAVLFSYLLNITLVIINVTKCYHMQAHWTINHSFTMLHMGKIVGITNILTDICIIIMGIITIHTFRRISHFHQSEYYAMGIMFFLGILVLILATLRTVYSSTETETGGIIDLLTYTEMCLCTIATAIPGLRVLACNKTAQLLKSETKDDSSRNGKGKWNFGSKYPKRVWDIGGSKKEFAHIINTAEFRAGCPFDEYYPNTNTTRGGGGDDKTMSSTGRMSWSAGYKHPNMRMTDMYMQQVIPNEIPRAGDTDIHSQYSTTSSSAAQQLLKPQRKTTTTTTTTTRASSTQETLVAMLGAGPTSSSTAQSHPQSHPNQPNRSVSPLLPPSPVYMPPSSSGPGSGLGILPEPGRGSADGEGLVGNIHLGYGFENDPDYRGDAFERTRTRERERERRLGGCGCYGGR